MVRRQDRGFSLIEAVMAVSLLAVGVSALAQLAIMSGRAVAAAERAGVVQQAARERLEQLRSLAWTSDADVVPISDWSSDLTSTPPRASGGVGLSASPQTALASNTRGFCDFLDVHGRWLAGGTRAPAGTAWIRRWSIAPVEGLADTLMMQVVVVPAAARSDAAAIASARASNGAWLVAMRMRKAR